MKDQHFTGLTARFKLDKVEDVPATVSLTASLRFWKEAAQALSGDGYGAWQVRAAIREVIDQANASFYHRIEADADVKDT
jgi:hypothetical protein